jgi:membrane-bound serine protease (ClpP class)
MLQKACLVATGLVILIVANAPIDWPGIQTLAGWSQAYWGSLLSLALAMLTLVPALISLGTGFIESVSALSFAMFFWGRFQTTHDFIPLLIFFVGAFFVGVEVLVVPGLGKPFALGAVCISAAILKSYPDSHQGMQALLTAYGALGTGLYIGLKYLPSRRFAALKPPTAAESAFDPGAALQQHVGKSGESTTALKPSGKVMVDGQIYGARTNKAFVAVNTPVRVVRVESNQLIVEPVG